MEDSCERYDFGMDKVLVMKLERKLVCIVYAKVTPDDP